MPINIAAGAPQSSARTAKPAIEQPRQRWMWQHLVALLTLWSLLVVSPALAQSSLKVERLVEKGERLLAENQFEDAHAAFEKAVQRSEGRSLEALRGQGRALFRGERFLEAVTVSESMLALDDSLALQAEAHELAGDAHFEQARRATWLALQPSTSEAEAQRSAQLFFQKAEAAYRQAIEVDGTSPHPLELRLVEILLESGEDEQAIEALERYRAAGGAGEHADTLACWLGLTKRPPQPVNESSNRPTSDAPLYEPPKRVSAPVHPQLPAKAQKPGFSGVVTVRALISQEGLVHCPRVLVGVPFGGGDLARDAVREWRFEPARLRGQPVDVFYEIRVHLESKGRTALVIVQ